MAGWEDAPIVSGGGSWQDAPVVNNSAPTPPAQNVQPGRKVIATAGDGKIYEDAQGVRSFASPGYSTNDPAAIERIMQGATPMEEVQGSFDRQRIAANPIAARVQEFNQGAPFVGEWLDEAVGLVSPDAAKNMNALSDSMERQHPGQSTLLNVAGGISYAIPTIVGAGGQKAAEFIGRGGNAITQAIRTGLLAAPAAAADSAASFSGRAESGQRGSAAITGGIVGGGLGAALGALAQPLGMAATDLVKRVKRLDVTSIADEFGISMPAARVVKKALLNDDLDAAAARLGQLGDDAFLADAGPATGQLLNAASATGGDALATTRRAVTARSDQIGKRLAGKLDEILGKPVGVKTAAREIASGTSAARKAAYDRAYSMPIDYSGQGRTIESVLERIPPRTLKSAIDEANDAMTEAGLRNLQIMAEIGDDGAVVFREMPNVQQLDEIKKSLDAIGRESVDQFGRPTAQGARAKRLAAQLRDAVSEAVPAYRAALRAGGDKIQQDEALDLGRKLLFKNTTVEDVKSFLRTGTSSEARAAARQGVRETIENSMSNVRRTIGDPDVDAREAMQLVKEVSSRANKQKLRLLLGSDKANALLDELDRTATALALRDAVARSSDTAIRQSIQRQVSAEATRGLLRRTLGKGGNPLDAAREITETVAGIDPRTMSDIEKGIFDEIAQALTSIRGPGAQRALQSVQRALSGQTIKDAEAKLIGRMVATGLGVSGYQLGKQSTVPR